MKRILSLLLVAVMLVGLFPSTLAADSNPEPRSLNATELTGLSRLDEEKQEPAENRQETPGYQPEDLVTVIVTLTDEPVLAGFDRSSVSGISAGEAVSQYLTDSAAETRQAQLQQAQSNLLSAMGQDVKLVSQWTNLVNAVVAVAPMSVVCQGFSKEKGITVMPGSSWSFHGEEVPYNSFGIEKFPFGQVLRKSLKAREVTMYGLYLPMVEHPNPAAVIRVENITGPILLISSKMDTMWPSEPAAKRIMERLREKGFSCSYQHLSYDYGSHLFVPMELSAARFFRGDRGKYKELGRKARMDSLVKTLEFVSQW